MNKLYLATVLAMTAMISACGGSEGTSQETTAATEAAVTADGAETTGETETDAAETEADTAEDAEAASDEKPAAGVWEESVYTDPYAGIQFTLPEGWVAADEAMMESTFGSTETTEGIYAMMALDSSTGDNVIMMYENLAETAGILAGITDEGDYFDAIESQLSDQGLTVEGEPVEKTIGDSTYLCETATMESSGITMSQYYVIRKIDSYMFCIVFSVQDGQTLDDCLAMLA